MKILIVEDHLLLREGVRRVCVDRLGHTVIGEAEKGVAAIEMAHRLEPDLVILDLGLPDMDGFAVASRILKTLPNTRFLVLTGALDDYTVHRVLKFGFHGFMDKGSSAAIQLRTALESLSAGKTYFSEPFRAAQQSLRSNPHSFEKVLSASEQEILALVGEGLSDEEIGMKIGIAPTTSQTHRRNILQKLSIKGTPKLAAFAVTHGFTRTLSRSPFPQSR